MADSLDAPAQDWQQNAEYVGFNARAIAAILDTLALALPLTLILAPLFVMVGGGSALDSQAAALLAEAQADPEKAGAVLQTLFSEGHMARKLYEHLAFTLVMATVVLAAWHYFAATPGKMLLGMKIIDADTGLPLSTSQSIQRYLGYMISTFVFCLGFIWVAFDKRKQGWHDKMANTVVVYKRSLPPELAQQTHYAEAKTRKEG